MSTTPTAEEFRNVIADELEALAKRVREPSTYVSRAITTGHVSVGGAGDVRPMTSTVRESVYNLTGHGYTASVKIVGPDPEVMP